MSNGSGDGHNEHPHHGPRPGLKRRLLRWWFNSAFYRGYVRAADALYDWWHPRSEGVHGYGYRGHSRQTRLGRAWSKLRRWAGGSAPVRGYRRLVFWLYDW